MFIESITGSVTELLPSSQTRFLCSLQLQLPIGELGTIEPGRLVAAENLYFSAKEKRYTILQIFDAFPDAAAGKVRGKVTVNCTATPMGHEMTDQGKRKGAAIVGADTFPTIGGNAHVLDDDITQQIIHQIAPERRTQENGSRIDIGSYRANPQVTVGFDAGALQRGNAAVISTRPRARTTIVNNLVGALMTNQSHPVHVVYCDVNNQGTLSLANMISGYDKSGIVCLNDKFVPSSVFSSLRNTGDRSAHKRAVLDYLDMMILPSVMEDRRHDFTYAVSNWLRSNKISIFRPNEQTVDQFIHDISIDILDGVDEDTEEYMNELINGIAETYKGERFNEKNTRDILDMVEEFSRDSRIHSSRRTLYDLKAEIQSVFETYSKDIPAASRTTMQDIVNQLNDDSASSLLVVQGQKTTDILRFIGSLTQTLVDERLRRLKIKVPVLFIFNNIDEYVGRIGTVTREQGTDRFQEMIGMLLSSGRRHGLGFCLSLENASTLDRSLSARIHSYFIGPVSFVEEPSAIADLLNLSEDLVKPAVHYEDGEFLFTSSDSPYHRRVPLPVRTDKNTDLLHEYLDKLQEEAERRRLEYQAQEEERRQRAEKEREERRRRDEEAARKNAEKEAEEAARAEAEEPADEEAADDEGAKPQASGSDDSVKDADTVEGDEANGGARTSPATTTTKTTTTATRRSRRGGSRKRGGSQKKDTPADKNIDTPEADKKTDAASPSAEDKKAGSRSEADSTSSSTKASSTGGSTIVDFDPGTPRKKDDKDPPATKDADAPDSAAKGGGDTAENKAEPKKKPARRRSTRARKPAAKKKADEGKE